jgi:hypothetical protein
VQSFLIAAAAIVFFAATAAFLRLRQEPGVGSAEAPFRFLLFVAGTFRPGLMLELGFAWLVALTLLGWQRRGALGHGLVLALLVALYAVSFVKSLMLDEAVRVDDLQRVRELARAAPVHYTAAVLLLGAGWVAAFLRNAARPRGWAAAWAATTVLSIVTVTRLGPGTVVGTIEQLRPSIAWDRHVDVRRNGLLVTMLRHAARSEHMARDLAAVDPAREPVVLGAVPVPAHTRSLYIISLESFVDPRNLAGTPQAGELLDPTLAEWLDESRGLLLSPVFGGNSAQAEFEVLCGIPAFGDYGVDYLLLDHPVPCLPRRLGEIGYRTLAGNPVSASSFGSRRAYEQMGFQHTWFADDFDLSDRDGLALSAGSQFEQMRAFVAAVAQDDRPRLVLFETVAGHWPFEMDRGRRPPILPPGRWAHDLANAAHYNSAAAVALVQAIEREDPDAVVVVYGDHLPPQELTAPSYRDAGYRVRQVQRPHEPFWRSADPLALDRFASPVLIRSRGRPIAVGLQPAYVLPEVLVDLLTEGAYCREHPCLARNELLVRPLGGTIAFTTGERFPERSCVQGGEESAACAAATSTATRLRRAYLGLLARGAFGRGGATGESGGMSPAIAPEPDPGATAEERGGFRRAPATRAPAHEPARPRRSAAGRETGPTGAGTPG